MRSNGNRILTVLDFGFPKDHCLQSSYYAGASIVSILVSLSHCKYIMRLLYTILSLVPAPLFFMGFIWSLFYSSPICGTDYAMTAMWFIMSLAHVLPWLLWLQQRNFTRP